MFEPGDSPKGSLQSSNTSTPVLRRARVACKACNARRVKCDAADGQPCWHCRTRQTACELIESRRGKYTRKRHGRTRDVRGSGQSQEASHPPASRVDSDAVDGTIDTGLTNGTRERTAEEANDRGNSVEIPCPGRADNSARECTQTSDTQSYPRLQQLAEPLSLSYVVEVVYSPGGGSTEPLKVHYPIPASIVDGPDVNHAPRVEELVSLQEALTMPPRDIADQLIQAFFYRLHPAYPVFDRQRFTRLYHQGQASPLVLQTIFFLGFTVGSEELLHAAGYSDRAIARKTHYIRAKALYDADYEPDRMNLVAVLLLFGFCASQSGMSQPMRSLRKRIWWALYTRDRHVSAAFGRPCRIRDEDCDIEALDADDFNFDSDYDQTLIPAQTDYHIAYMLEMTKLVTIQDLLGAGMIKYGLIHLVPSLFSALSVHTIVICRKDPIRRQLAENKSRQCLLALSELASSWPVKIWIAKAFVNLLRRLTVQGSASIINVSSSIANNRTLSGRSNPSGLHHTHSPKQTGLDNSVQNDSRDAASYINRPQLRDVQPSGGFPHAADHLVYNSFWASYLTNTFDVEFLLHNGLGPTLAGPFDGLGAAEGQSSLHF
ncbi:hypothetical protein BDV26DRAFT_282527 [Aspergillus bertholletiae]|uniref:Zn(2)-C6 fungal-type domain-containing protein n=1 Tax=Aspergillus bertholletiae TaxID=1226010 RepID=A0A5N7B3Q2_9EURO|nr:hypothetical protein BDV26DRAFT_282527 [Aspergillus bertholletiae]